jgi:hypothetical protein
VRAERERVRDGERDGDDDRPVRVACPGCRARLGLIQPHESMPEVILGVCPRCEAIYSVSATTWAVIRRLEMGAAGVG